MSEQQQHHYFASHAMGWVTADTQEEAVEKLLLTNTDSKWANNCLKAGEPLVFYTTRVPLPQDAHYSIEWFAPQVEGCTEGANHLVTYLTKKTFAIMDDPRDEIKRRKQKFHEVQQALLNLSYAVACSESIHDDDVQSSLKEARELIPEQFKAKQEEMA